MRYKCRSGCNQHIQNEKVEFVCGNLSVTRLDLAKSLSRMGGNCFEGLSPLFSTEKNSSVAKISAASVTSAKQKVFFNCD